MTGGQVGGSRMEGGKKSQVMSVASATVRAAGVMRLGKRFIASHAVAVMVMRHDNRNQHHQTDQKQHIPDDLFLSLHNRLWQR